MRLAHSVTWRCGDERDRVEMRVSEAEERVSPRRILGLAIPALGVLAAAPLYVLVDTAVIGRLGAVPLAGLALGGTLFTLVSSQLTFLKIGRAHV